jgi:hypothetical protein
MKNLFEAETAEEMKARIRQLRQDTPALWGKMSAAQMVEHCARSLEWAVGDTVAPRAPLPLRILGRVIKPLALGNDKPMRRNSPTAPVLVVEGEPEIGEVREKLCTLIDRFSAGGPSGCTTQPHTFFGKMRPQEWGVLVYKHTDHHLRQFGV